MSRPTMIILDETMTVQDLARALQYSGFAVSNTNQSTLFVIKKAPRRLPPNVVEFDRPAFIRLQAD
jgi:hypothetical protein